VGGKKKRRKRRRKKGASAVSAGSSARGKHKGVPSQQRTAAASDPPQQRSQTAGRAPKNTDAQSQVARSRWRSVRVRAETVAKTVDRLLERREVRERRKQLSKSAHSGRVDVQEAYRQLYFEEADQKGEEVAASGQMGQAVATFMERDHWRVLVDKNPLLADKIVVIDYVSRRLRASFMRLGATVGATEWEAVFRHYDKDGSGGLDLSEFINAVRSSAVRCRCWSRASVCRGVATSRASPY
jgi:hypothetical protein